MMPSANQNIFRPGMRSGLFGHGLFGGLMAGFLGAGLFGLLFGHGLFGGLGGGFSFLGLLLQIGLIYLIVRFAMNFFGNNQPSMYGSPLGGGFAGGGGWQTGYGSQASGPPLPITADDYDAFERALAEVQAAYSAEDLNRLRQLATAEMVSYFAEELEGNARRGLVDRLSATKLLKGDLSEAWREGGAEYASVAMRFSLIDTMIERASGRIVSGSPNVPEEVPNSGPSFGAPGRALMPGSCRRSSRPIASLWCVPSRFRPARR